MPPVLQIRTVPSCGKIRRAERFSVRTRRAGADVPGVLQARATQLWRKRSGAPRDFPSEQGVRAQICRLYFKSAQCHHAERSGAPRDFPSEQGVRAQTYRVYFKPAQRSYGGKDPARARNSSRVNSKLTACINAFALKCSGRPISRWRALRRWALSGLPLKPRV